MVYNVVVNGITKIVTSFSVMTNRKHSYNDLEELVKVEVPEYNTEDYYFEYTEL